MAHPETEDCLKQPVTIEYQKGTLLVFPNYYKGLDKALSFLQWDHRTRCLRCHADKYRELIRFLYKSNIRYSDFASIHNRFCF